MRYFNPDVGRSVPWMRPILSGKSHTLPMEAGGRPLFSDVSIPSEDRDAPAPDRLEAYISLPHPVATDKSEGGADA